MNSDARKTGTRGFAVKQTILLLVTIGLVVFFTVPLLKAVKAAANPGELQADVAKANNEVVGLRTKIDVARSKMLMGAGDDEAQEKLKKQVEALQRQMALKDLENKHLQDQMALVRTMLQMVKPASAPAAAVPSVDSTQKIVELLMKVFGCIGSIFSGGLFVVNWWKKRQALLPAASQSTVS